MGKRLTAAGAPVALAVAACDTTTPLIADTTKFGTAVIDVTAARAPQ